MDRSGEFRRGIFAFVALLSLVLSSMVLLAPVPESQAAKSDEVDEYGYYWMDNKAPDPRVEYNWINVRNVGTELSINDYYYGYDDILLPDWSFPLYGIDYDTIYVGSRGLIWFNDIGTAPTDYSSYPSSNEPNPSIAACYGYPWTTTTQYGGVHYLTGMDSIGRWVCIEWNSNYYGQTYEVVLWETGLIKMQYNNLGSSSGYSNGQYMSVGIEDEDGSVYSVYSQYGTANLNNGLAIEFSTEYMTMANFEVVGTGGPNNHTAFAELKYYEISFDVMSSSDLGDLSSVRVYFGPPSLGIYISYDYVGGLPTWSVGGGGEYILFDIQNSTDRTSILTNGSGINAKAYVMFLFGIPLDGNISVTLWSRGKTALPNMMEIEDAMYLDSKVKLAGDLVVFNEAGNMIPNEAYTRENENITFTGLMLTYNSTGMVYPPNSSFIFKLTDDELVDYFDFNVSARNVSIWYVMPSIAVRKTFTMALLYGNGDPFPAGKFIGTFPPYAFRVDDSTPIAPASLIIRADSFKDKVGSVDNDEVLFISWSSVKDSGSGVVRYRISTTYAPGDDSVPYVDSKVTQYIWNGTTEGVFRVVVWAEDGVGHAGDPADSSIVIDMKDPYFVDFTPDPVDVPWIKTLTPDLSIGAKDNLTISDAISGVRPSTIEYSISTSGIDNFEEWVSADLHDDEENIKNIDTIAVKLKPRFVEGKENYIRYRAKDYAGNGYAYSEIYNLKIDVTPVAVQEFFPTPNVWHDLDVLLEREIECYLYDETSGILSNKIYYRISNGYDEETNTHSWVTGIPQHEGWQKLPAKDWDRVDGDKLVYIHFSYAGFQEGEENYIQFMYRDVAGTGQITPYTDFGDKMTFSQMYQIKINTQPVAMISEPVAFPIQSYYITEMVTFDASDSYDVDVDEGNLKYEWFCHELNKSIGYDEIIDTVRFPAKGWYNITLYVGDSVHRLDPISGVDKRSTAEVMIFIDVFEINDTADEDEDEMLDKWEWQHFLTLGYDDSDEDPDGDGFLNIDEFNEGTDPMDPTDYPELEPKEADDVTDEAPFELWLFMLILLAALIIAAVVVLLGYLRIHRQEQQEQTEEAEEEAMLATPQLDIPTMPPQIPMVDTSVPTLPAPAESDMPPAEPMGDQMPVEGQPLPEEPVPQPEPVPAPVEPPMPEQAPAPDPMYEQPGTEAQDPMYQPPQ